MSEKKNVHLGVIQHGLGFYCLDCHTYFHSESTWAAWTHPDLSGGIVPKMCENNGKTYKIPVLEEIK